MRGPVGRYRIGLYDERAVPAQQGSAGGSRRGRVALSLFNGVDHEERKDLIDHGRGHDGGARLRSAVLEGWDDTGLGEGPVAVGAGLARVRGLSGGWLFALAP